jgi:hypothetical protein
MPRYFFHVQDGQTFLDKEGSELPGLKEVRAEAIMASGEMLRDNGRSFWGGTEWRMWVTDEGGNTVCTMKFSAEAPA